MRRIVFPAMGTQVEAWCPPASREQVRDWFEEVEDVCSRFRPGSELSRINTHPGSTHRLSPLLADVLVAAATLRALTDGMVDIGVGNAVRHWGYDRTFAEVSELAVEPAAVPSPDWEVEEDTLTLAEGTSLDLGGVAKGWACDQAVDRGMASVVSAGGDMRSADDETTVSVLDPWGSVAARIRIGRAALATSSTARRRWKVSNREVCHLIDPRTMAPIRTPVLSATVVADRAVEAEAGAKAVLLHGGDGLAWAAEQAWISAALVVWHDGSVYATPGLETAA